MGDSLYVAGNFWSFGPPSGGGLPVDPRTGNTMANCPRVAGWVTCAVADGGGGWFIGGWFRGVGGLPRRNLAHILADGSVAPWGPDPDATVTTMALAGNKLYIGGLFETVADEQRLGLAAVDARTGRVAAWDPRPVSHGARDAPGLPRAILVHEGTVYVGGVFHRIGGAERNWLAALDTLSGDAQSWDPKCDSWVYALAAHRDRLYVGGAFRHVGGKARNLLAAVALSADTVMDWAPAVDRVPESDWDRGMAVLTIAPTDSTVFIGGRFNRVAGLKRVSLACIDANSGLPTSWDARADGDYDPVPGPTFETVMVSGQVVYAGGIFFLGLGGRPFTDYPGGDFIGALDIRTGDAVPWDPRPNGDVSVLCESGGRIFMGGSFTSVRDWVRRHGLAALDMSTGSVTSWAPTFDGIAWAMIAYERRLYLGGQIFSINGQSRANLASLDPVSGRLTDWTPACGGIVKTLAAAGGRVYVGGYFNSMGGQPRLNLAAVDTAQGAPTAWNPGADDIVTRVIVRDGLVYVGGIFKHVGDEARNEIAVVDTAMGTPTSWNSPGPVAGGIYDIAVGDSAVFVAGQFDAIGTTHRDDVAALDRKSGEVLPWDAHFAPTARLELQSGIWEGRGGAGLLASSAGALYVSGGFSAVGGSPRERLVALDPATGEVLDWDPGAPVQLFDITEREVVLGGSFPFVGPEPTFALARVPPAPARHALPSSTLHGPNFSLSRPAPNPIQDDGVIGFELRSAARVSLELFDASGRHRQTYIHDGYVTAGPHAYPLSTRELEPGLYFFRLKVGDRSGSRPLVVRR